MNRTKVAYLSISAMAFVGLLTYEGYTDRAIIPVPGDKPTMGFGTTDGVTMNSRTNPVEAVQRALKDAAKFEGAVKTCVKVPLHQYEYDAYISLSYNIGQSAFCSSTLVKKLNAGAYAEACKELLRWDKFKGQPLRGLTIRRQSEYQLCIGQS